ncbi:MAG TPA: hypothetical protein VF403_00710 [Kofleriaceae bacterium]
MQVLIAVADVGSGVQLEEALNRAGFEARWDAGEVDGPRAGHSCECVLIDADHLAARLADVTLAWRDQPSVPGVVAIGNSPEAREFAPAARVTLLSTAAKIATLGAAIQEAAKLRLATGMRWSIMRAALKLPPIDNTIEQWPATLLHSRNVDLEVARSALRWHVQHYVTATPLLEQLRDERILVVPELETIAHADGTKTVQTLVKAGPLDPMKTARLLWALASLGAITVTPEVRDPTSSGQRSLDEIRKHLRARVLRLERSTYFDVLEITPLADYPEIEASYQLLGSRYSPAALQRYDLAELVTHIKPTWELIEKARAVLVDDAHRGRYTDYLRQNLATMKTQWAIDTKDSQLASEAFARGQAALGEGDAHKAMSHFAKAARHHPGHPDYEATLAWVRYRVQVASGRDQVEHARIERAAVESYVVGCRPWPRALVALALLCAAGGDADSARWHLAIALSIDPNVPAAAQLAQRLGLRR